MDRPPLGNNEFHLRVLSAHRSDFFWEIAWSPDGSQIASASEDSTVRIWDTRSGKLLRSLEGHIAPVRSVSWSHDGRALASASYDNTVRIWDPASGSVLRSLEGHAAWVTSVSWSHDGKTLAGGSYDNTVRVWDATSGRVLRSLEGHAAWVASVSWSHDDKTLASASYDNTVRIWDAASGKFLRSFQGHADAVRSVSWSRDGRALASASDDKTVRIWDPVSGKLLRSLEGHAAPVTSVSWSLDGRALASASDDSTVRIWDPVSGAVLRSLEGLGAWVASVSWSHDGRALASASADKTVRIWDPASGKLLRSLQGHSAWGASVSWSRDGHALACGSADGAVRVWDPASGKLRRALQAHTALVTSVSWSHDGHALACASRDKTVRIWDPTSGELLRSLEGHADAVRSVSWSHDDRALASASDDSTIRIWDPASGEVLRSLEGHADFVITVSWSPDGKALASASYDNTVRIWDPASGELLRSLEGHADLVITVSWSPDGKALASASYDNTVRIWDPASGKLLRSLEGHAAPVTSVSWSRDNKALASASEDNTVRIWDPNTGAVLAVHRAVKRSTHQVLDLAFCAKTPLVPSYGTTALGDPDVVVTVIDDVARAATAEEVTQVACAKIVLVGESNVGKSYLAHRIATGHAPDAGTIQSTHGMAFWPLDPEQLGVESRAPAGQRMDVVLWDMGGQEEYRLIHQLFLHDTSVALLLFDPTRGLSAFKEVETWNNYLIKQLRERQAVKLLVGTKLDHPTDTLDRAAVDKLRAEGGFAGFHETSAITGRGIDDVRRAVGDAIRWEAVSRPVLFQRIRDEIEARRRRGDVVLHLADLHRALDADLHRALGEQANDNQQAVGTVVDQLAKQGIIARSRAATGEEVLVLQVQVIERYASSLVLAARNNPRGIPALELRAIPQPDFGLPGMPAHDRLPRVQERAVLECTVELLLDRGICFEHEGMLVFPTLFAAESVRGADAVPLPHAVSLYYDFAGAIDNIYASLVAWLVLARDFGRVRLWHDRAEFEVNDGGLCGLRKVARPGGFAHVDVYFEDKTPPSRRDEFISFVEDHLHSHGIQMTEHVAIQCPCGHELAEQTLRERIARGKKDVVCPVCETQHSLHEGAAAVRQGRPAIDSRLWALKTEIGRSRKEVTQAAKQTLEMASRRQEGRRPIRLLHLSDLHLTAETPVSARLQWLLNDLRLDTGLGVGELDYLVVSGDFTHEGGLEGFEKACEFLSGLIGTFGLSAERCILVPGNHDLDEPIDAYTRRRDSKGLRDGEWTQQGRFVFARDPEQYPLRLKPFSDSLYHKVLQRPYPMAVKDQGMAVPFWEDGLQFLTLNSCWEIDEFDRKRAGVHPEAVANCIAQAQKQVEDARKSGRLAQNKKLLRIGVWHHAVTGIECKMKDLQFLGNLQKNDVKLVLHGDVHQMERDLFKYWQTNRIHVAGAGSFGARSVDRGESIPRLYNLLEIERDLGAIKVHTRQQQTPDGDWDGWHVWENPDSRQSRLAHYAITL